MIERINPNPFVITPGAGMIQAPDHRRSGVKRANTCASVARSALIAAWSESRSMLEGGNSSDSYWNPPSPTVSSPRASASPPDLTSTGYSPIPKPVDKPDEREPAVA